jgi:hypothetical protein
MKRILLACAAALLAHGCTSLPDYARPTVELQQGSPATPSDWIWYRPITRADFRADAPLPAVAAHAAKMGAFTCGLIAPDPEGEIPMRIEPAGSGFVARPAAPIQVRARMDRGCSWWNPKPPVDVPEYTLEHEQIHFALFELAARDATRRLAGAEGRGRTAEAALDDFNDRFATILGAVSEELLRRSTDFDEDTSIRQAPVEQRRWWDRIQTELGHPGAP